MGNYWSKPKKSINGFTALQWLNAQKGKFKYPPDVVRLIINHLVYANYCIELNRDINFITYVMIENYVFYIDACEDSEITHINHNFYSIINTLNYKTFLLINATDSGYITYTINDYMCDKMVVLRTVLSMISFDNKR